MTDPSKRPGGEAGGKIDPGGVIVFVVVCVLMAAALFGSQTVRNGTMIAMGR